jgi:hypothetical protein
MKIQLRKSKKAGKKYSVSIHDKEGKRRTVHFGQAGASDYTINKDDSRKSAYLSRHKARENWTKSGIGKAGFWSRWLLWNKHTIKQSIQDIERRFGVAISR